MKINIEFPRKLLEVYNDACKPLCKKLKLPQTAFDISDLYDISGCLVLWIIS